MAKLKAPKFQDTDTIIRNSVEQSNAQRANVNTNNQATQTTAQWYSGPQPTLGETYARISQIAQEDYKKGTEAWNMLKQLQNDPNSIYYNHYGRATNSAIANLQSYGIDTSKLNDAWFEQNDGWIRSNLEYRGRTNTPSAPLKNSTKNQRIAYELYQYRMASDLTKKADEEYDRIVKKAMQYAQWDDRNYSDDEIIAKVRGNFEKDYPTLYEMEHPDYSLLELNHGFDFSDDTLRGYIWMARNPDQNVSIEAAMANSYLGNGNQWKEDPDKTEKLTLGSDKYNPYDVGSTMEKECLFFNRTGFDKQWLDDNYERYYVNGTEEEKENYKKVWDQEEQTSMAEKAVSALELWKSQLKVTDPAKAQQKFDALLDSGKLYIKTDKNGNQKLYTTPVTATNGSTVEVIDLNVLNKMDKSIGKGDQNATGDLLGMNRRIGYKYGDFVAGLAEQCEKNKSVKTDADDMNDIIDGVTKRENPSLNDVFNMMNKQQEPAETETKESAPVDESIQPDQNPVENKEQEAPANTKIGDTASTGKSDLFPKYTEAEMEDIQIRNEKINDAAETLGDVLTEDEAAVMNNAGSVLFYDNKDRYTAIMSDEEARTIFTDKAVQTSTKNMVTTGFENLHDIEMYRTTEANLGEWQKEFDEYKEKYGDVELLQKDLSPERKVQIGDFSVSMTFNEAENAYQVTNIYAPGRGGGMSYEDILDYAEQGIGWASDIINQANEATTAETQDELQIRSAHERVEAMGDQAKNEVDRYKHLVPAIQNAEEYLTTNKDSYEKQNAAMQDAMNDLYNMLDAAEILGRDTAPIMEAIDFMEGMVDFYYEPSLPVQVNSKLDAINIAAGFIGEDWDAEQKSKMLQNGIKKADEEIAEINKKIAYAEEHGYEIPGLYRKHMEQKIQDLENDKKAYEYSLILTETDPEELDKAIKAGEEFEKKFDQDFIMQCTGYKTLNNQEWYTDGLGGEVVSDNDKKVYYYLLGKKVLEMGDALEDDLSQYGSDLNRSSTAAIEVMSDAMDYYKFMRDENSGYGLWSNKEADKIAGYSKELTDSGTLGTVAANAMSTLVTPAESLANAWYALETAITGRRFSTETRAGAISGFKKETREETFNKIDKAFEDNPVAKYVARLGYEIYVNRGDSLMNSITFGGLIPSGGIFGSKFGSMLGEFAGATPMGISAGVNAALEAVENGATTEQAWAMLGATFIAETATEAITLSNIKEALGATEGLTKDTLMNAFKNWITKDGLEEMFGETLNDVVENWADTAIANMVDNPNYQSEHQQLVDYYMSQGFTGEGEAEQKALEQELKGYAHTAFVSFLSAGTNVMLRTGKAAVNTVHDILNGYRGFTKAKQKRGYSKSMIGYMAEDAKKLIKGTKNESAVATEQGTEQKTEQTPIQAEEKKTVTDNAKKAAVAASAAAVARRNGITTQTEAIASILDNGDGDGVASDQASAAAAYLPNVVGDRSSVVVQEVMLGAANTGINTEEVTTAIQYAALGNGAATRMMQTDLFKNATPEQKARMLVSTIEQDQSNPEVQQNVAAKVKDFRTTMQMNDLAANGHFDQAKADRAAAVEATRATAEAQTEAESRTEAAQAANNAATDINNRIVNEGATDENLKEQNQALDKVQATEEVEKQAKQHLDKTQKAQQEAEAKADQSRKDAYNSAKQIADQKNAEIDQQREQTAFEKAQAERLAREQAEQEKAEAKRQQMIEDQRSGKLAEDAAEAKLRAMAEERGLSGEEADNLVREGMEIFRASQVSGIDMSKQFSKAQAELMRGALQRRFGVKIVFEDLGENDTGKYDPKTNTITLNKNVSAGQAMIDFALHELTHSLETSKSYGKYQDLALKTMYGTEAELNEAIARKMADREEAGHPIDEEQAKRELVAEFTRNNLNSKEVVERMVDAGLGGKFRTWLHNIGQFLKNLRLNGADREMAENLRKAENLFIKAINEKNGKADTRTEVEYSTEGRATPAITEQEMIDAGIIAPLEGQHPELSTGQGTKVRAFASDNGMLQSADQLDRFAKAVVTAQNTYFPDTNADQINRAVSWIRSLRQTENSDGYAEALQAVTADDFDYRSADGQARMVAVMGLANAKNDVMAQAALADAYMRQGTDLGRALQARKLFKLMTPEGRISTLMKTLNDCKKDLKQNGKEVDLKFSDWVLQAAAYAETESDFRQVQIAAANELAEQLPSSWKERLQSFRMLSMLMNPRTHIRNIIGNALFVPAVGIKNKLAAAVEAVTLDKGERTKTLSLTLDKDIKAFAKQDAITIKDQLTGEAKYDEKSLVQKAKNPLGKVGGFLSDLNSNALEAEDWLFLKGHYTRALGGWMQANGYTAEQMQNDQALLEKGREYAINEAQKATYRDFNKIASKLNQLSREGGATGFFIDAVLPFKKTPANILRRGVEYSPVGIAKGLYNLAANVKNGNVTANQAIDQICSGLSGTAVMAIGYLLAGTGAVSCGLGDDEDKLEKAKGNQEYAVKFNLFGKDVTFTVDWAAPMSMPFFVGAAIRNQVDEEGTTDPEEILDAMFGITEPVFNLSMLDGINTLFKTSSYDSSNPIEQFAGKIITNYASSYVPSVLGAIARTIDDTRRKSFVESGKGTGIFGNVRYALENAQNKIPGWSQENIPVRDIWGEADTSSFAERLLENFILPGYINEYKEDPIINEMGRLFDTTGDKGMIPAEDPDKTITYNKVKHVLTDKQWDLYKETRNKTAHTMLTELINNADYQNASDATQVQMIKDIWNRADKIGQNAVFPEIEVTDKGENEVQTIASDAKISSYKDQMVKALEQGDYEAYDTMVEALREADVEDTKIKEKIGNKYRDPYKNAYRLYIQTGDEKYYTEMLRIEELLDQTDFGFDYGKWQTDVDNKYGW